ncbi:MAG: glutaminase [Pseudomonadota bacterium]
MSLTPAISFRELEALYRKYQRLNEGAVARYIPELAKAPPDDFAIAVASLDGSLTSIGESKKPITLQSISKPFVYGLALELLGTETVRRHVGVEPTGDAFNSLIELEERSHRPFNPLINSGAIAMSSLIPGASASERLERITQLFSAYAGHAVTVDHAVFLSERSTAHRNRAIAHLLQHFGALGPCPIDEALDLYFQQCSILMSTEDLALMAATLANGGRHPRTHEQVIAPQGVRDLLSIMFTCGMYDSSGEWAYTVGLPAKSGVSGGILAVVPGKMGIATYSPLLDPQGHSVRGGHVFRDLSQRFRLGIFET